MHGAKCPVELAWKGEVKQESWLHQPGSERWKVTLMDVGNWVPNHDVLGAVHSTVTSVETWALWSPSLHRLNGHECRWTWVSSSPVLGHRLPWPFLSLLGRVHGGSQGTVVRANLGDMSWYWMYKWGCHSRGYLANAEGCYCFQELSNPKG